MLGVRPLGFFIPYRYAGSVDAHAYPALGPLFAAAEPRQRWTLDAIEGVADDLLRIAGPPPAPRFDQGWFPTLDGAAAYGLIRRLAPQRIVEVGSGHSTRFLARAIQDGGLGTRLTAIDPAPRAELAGLAVDWRRCLLDDVPPETFSALEPGDVLFIDSSHVLMPGTDLDRLLNDVMPRLPAGVLVHLHDILLPDAYPAEWAWRGYNEQQAVAPLLWTGAFEIVFASHFVRTRRTTWLERSVVARLPRAPDAPPTSLWLRRAAKS
ncbi:MAG TPA: class I SAM-dependent methyltransferase [Geminicoccaceae bacterium]